MENICHRVKWVVVTKRVFWRFFNHKQALFILLLLLKWGQTKKDIISNEKEKPSSVSESYQSMRLSLCCVICSTSNKAYIFLGFLQTRSYILQFQMFSSNVNRKINSFCVISNSLGNRFVNITLLGTFPLECMVYSFVLSRGTYSPVMHTWSILSKKDTLSS